MILPALIDYYDRLPPDQKPPSGFAPQGVGFCLVLTEDGSLVELQSAHVLDAKGKPRRRTMELPDHGQKRTAQDRPFFLWDKTDYLFGVGREAKDAVRNAKRFELFRTLHLRYEDRVEHPLYRGFCAFLRTWSPERISEIGNWPDVAGENCIVSHRGQQKYLHEIPAARQVWMEQLGALESAQGICLTTGERAPIARLHPAIKGIYDPGGQAEKGIVAFNKDKTAFESYCKEQAYNAPVAVEAAFKYSSALNRLLADDRRRALVGDATVVFWSAKPTPFEDAFTGLLVGERAEDEATINRTRAFAEDVRQGRLTDELGDLDTSFFVLGLSPNAARVSVRYWLAGTVGEFVRRLGEHLRALNIVGAEFNAPLTIRRIVNTTARLKNNGEADYDSISPHLAGDVARAILSGTPYPRQLLSAVIGRIRADRVINHSRAAVAKACVIRNSEMEVPLALNPQHPSPSYHCGRMLALLDYAQAMAIGNVNAGIVKKFYGSASMQPAAVFGRLIGSATKAHIPKIKSRDPGLAQFIDREMQQITASIGDSFPTILALEDQGMFAIGFYQEQTELPQTPSAYRHQTERGEQVKSKSEVILANMLHSLNVNYQYELPLAVPDSRPLHPDFTVTSDVPSATIYIEHLGMLERDDYRQRWEAKQVKYRSLGVLPWEEGGGPNGKLVTTRESAEKGFDTAELRRLLERVFPTPE